MILFRAFCLMVCCFPVLATESLVLRYPALAEVSDQRSAYPLAVIELALAKMQVQASLKPSRSVLSKSRAIALLQQQRDIDIVWTMTSKQREYDLLPVRIPLMKGLGSYRALLIKQGEQTLFPADLPIKKLKQRVLAQGHDWVDTKILSANRFTVQSASDYPTMFQLLDKRRVDAVPRAVTEIYPEKQRYQQQGIALEVEQHWLLHYPSAVYLFVNKHNTSLAALLTQGLEKAIADGSFDQLFQQHYAAELQQLQLQQRQVVELINPFLPEETPVNRAELWYKVAAKEYTQLTKSTGQQ